MEMKLDYFLFALGGQEVSFYLIRSLYIHFHGNVSFTICHLYCTLGEHGFLWEY